MTNQKPSQDLKTRMDRLKRKQKEILGLPPEKALDAILEAEEPLPLVHSFAEEDFYFLVHEIGPSDALPILELASAKQWEYILDLETWEKDKVAHSALLKWMGLLMHADSGRLTAWLRDEKTDLLEFCLHRNVSLIMREHDEDPSDFGDDYDTVDDVYYFRIMDRKDDPESNSLDEEQRYEFLSLLLKQLAETDFIKYQQILVESTTVLPAEMEEEMYRLRNIRLAEKGFLPFEEALGIYQPLRKDEIKAFKRKRVVKNDQELIPFSLSPSVLLGGEDLFGRTVRSLSDETAMEQVRIEFAALCNRIVAADQTFVKEREMLRKVVEKASGYLSLGLQRLLDGVPGTAAEMLRQHSLADIFRIGYDRVMQLKDRAEKWRAGSWYLKNQLPLSFWGEIRVGVLGGLLIKRPLYFDSYETGILYREFKTAADVQRSESILQEIVALDHLLSLLLPSVPEGLARKAPMCDSLLLTLWARSNLGLRESAPIPLPRFKVFFRELFPPDGLTGSVNGNGEKNMLRRIPPAMKQAFLVWLGRETGLEEPELLGDLGGMFDKLFADIENEYGAVAVENLDPRYIHLFLVE